MLIGNCLSEGWAPRNCKESLQPYKYRDFLLSSIRKEITVSSQRHTLGHSGHRVESTLASDGAIDPQGHVVESTTVPEGMTDKDWIFVRRVNDSLRVRPNSSASDSIERTGYDVLLDWWNEYATTGLFKSISILCYVCVAHFDAPVLKKIKGMLDPECKLFDFGDLTLEGAVEMMKQCSLNWAAARENQGVAAICRLMSAVALMMYGDKSDIEFKIGPLTLFSLEAASKALTCVTFIDAIVEATAYVLSSVKTYSETGDAKCFIYGDDPILDFGTKAIKLGKAFAALVPGNTEKLDGYTEEEFARDLEDTIAKGYLLAKSYTGLKRRRIMDQVAKLESMHSDYTMRINDGSLRVAPLTILIAGQSSIAKSSLSQLIMRYTLAVNHFSHFDRFIYTYASASKYLDGYKSYVTGILMDDWDQFDFTTDEGKAVLNFLLRVKNNVPFTPEMAALEEKGVVSVRPKVLVGTSNGFDFVANVKSIYAFLRRWDIRLHAKLHPDFNKNGVMDTDKLSKAGLFPEAWIITVYALRKKKSDTSSLSGLKSNTRIQEKYEYVVATMDGRKLENTSLKDVLLYLKEYTSSYYKLQNKIVESNSELNCRFLEDGTLDEDLLPLVEPACEVPLNESIKFIEDLPNLYKEKGDVEPNSAKDLTIAKKRVLRLLEDNEARSAFLKEQSRVLFGAGFVMACDALDEFIERWSDRLMLAMQSAVIGHMRGTNVSKLAILSYHAQEIDRVIGSVAVATYATVATFTANLTIAVAIAMVALILPVWLYVNRARGIKQLIAERFHKSGARAAKFTRDYPLVYDVAALAILTSPSCQFDDIRLRLLVGMLAGKMMFVSLEYKCVKIIELYHANVLSLIGEESRVGLQLATGATLGFLNLRDAKELVSWTLALMQKVEPNGLTVDSVEELNKRDEHIAFDKEFFKEQAEDYLDPLPIEKPRTPKEVRDIVARSTWYVKTPRDGSCCYVVKTCYVIVPLHLTTDMDENEHWVFTRHNRGNKGNNTFTELVSRTTILSAYIKNKSPKTWQPDFCVVKVHNTGAISRAAFEVLPLKLPLSVAPNCEIITRRSNGRLESEIIGESQMISRAKNGLGDYFPGTMYSWKNAEPGTCMSPVIDCRAKTCIVGFHISSMRGGGLSYSVTLTQGLVQSAINKIEGLSGVMPNCASSELPEPYGMKLVNERTVKSRSCFLRLGIENGTEFLGTSSNPNRTFKTRVRHLMIEKDVRSEFNVKQEWSGPKFKGPNGREPHRPWEVGLTKLLSAKVGLPHSMLGKAVEQIIMRHRKILNRNKAMWMHEMTPLSFEEGVNGRDGKRFMEQLNMASSAGPPFSGPKRNLVKSREKRTDLPDFLTLDPRIEERVEEIHKRWRNRERAYVMFTTTLKDEPTPVGKEKVRPFQAIPIAEQIAIRQLILPLQRFLQMNPLETSTTVGINPASAEWDEMFRYIDAVDLDSQNWIAIDYKSYDACNTPQLIEAVGYIMRQLAKDCGAYLTQDLIELESIFSELKNPMVDFNGDVLLLQGTTSSGVTLTVTMNDMVNQLLLRMFFNSVYPGKDFDEEVRCQFYGDDMFGKVSTRVPDFNMKAYQQFCGKNGFMITSCDKKEKVEAYYSLTSIDFLKRKFVWRQELGRFVGPLCEESIFKRLCMFMQSETDERVIAAAAIDGALDEFFLHGRNKFNYARKKLNKIVNKHRLGVLCKRAHLTYDDRIEEWMITNHVMTFVPSKTSRIATITYESDDIPCEWANDCTDVEFCAIGELLPNSQVAGSRKIKSTMYICEDELPQGESPDHCVEPNSEYDDIVRSLFEMAMRCRRDELSSSQPTGRPIDTAIENEDFERTMREVALSVLRKAAVLGRTKYDQIAAQMATSMRSTGIPFSGPLPSYDEILEGVEPNSEKEQNVTLLHDGIETLETVQGSIDDTRSSRVQHDADLGKFLARPVKVTSFNWVPGNPLDETFNPLQLFLENARVKARISGFRHLSCTVRVKVMINGNSFYYGRAMCAWKPLDDFDQIRMEQGDPQIQLLQMSQLPNIKLDPTTSRGGVMSLPFFWHKDFLDITTEEWRKFGQIYLAEINPLAHTSGDVTAANVVPISFYVHLENVNLFGLTHMAPVVPNAKDEREGEKGPVGKAATAIEKVAVAAAEIEFLAPFALPAAVGARCVGSVANVFGWSAPSMVEAAKLSEVRGAGNTAACNVPDSAMKLTYDVKQETTVDSRVYGLDGKDELLIQHIASRESYLHTFAWSFGTLEESMLSNIRVDPCVFLTDNINVKLGIPAVCGATLPFETWTGEMVYRIEVVASAFHKGRMAIVYDPVETPDVREDNANYTQIVDISHTRDFEISVCPSQSRIFMHHLKPGIHPATEGVHSAPLQRKNYGNGTLSFWVFNELTVPNTPTSQAFNIFVNVYVRAGRDFEVARPVADYANYHFSPNSIKVYPNADEVSKVVDVGKTDDDLELFEMCQKTPRSGNIAKVFYGERIGSFRGLLKRYHGWVTRVGPEPFDPTTCNIWRLELCAHPYYRGKWSHGIDETLTNKYNYCRTTLINYLGVAYAGKKGSIRYKVFPRCTDSSKQQQSAVVSLSELDRYSEYDGVFSGSQSNIAKEAMDLGVHKGAATALFNLTVNPTMEFEIPWYSSYRFEPGRRVNYTSLTGEQADRTFLGFRIEMDFVETKPPILEFMVAAGEDFNLSFFIGWPVMYRQSLPAAKF